MDKHRARNHKEKEEREKEQTKRIHEATHAQSSGEGVPDAVLSTGRVIDGLVRDIIVCN